MRRCRLETDVLASLGVFEAHDSRNGRTKFGRRLRSLAGLVFQTVRCLHDGRTCYELRLGGVWQSFELAQRLVSGLEAH